VSQIVIVAVYLKWYANSTKDFCQVEFVFFDRICSFVGSMFFEDRHSLR